MKNTIFYSKNALKSKETKEAIDVICKAFEAAIEKSNFDILSIILDTSKKLNEIVKTGSLQECYACTNLAFWYIGDLIHNRLEKNTILDINFYEQLSADILKQLKKKTMVAFSSINLRRTTKLVRLFPEVIDFYKRAKYLCIFACTRSLIRITPDQ